MEIKPFQFKLKKLNAAELKLLGALFEFLPKTGVRAQFHGAVIEALTKHLGVEAHYHLDAVSNEISDILLERLPDPSVFVVVGMAPSEGKIVFEIDERLANLIVERLLGATAEVLPVPKPLSDIEQGVLQYFILQILSHIYRLCGKSERLHFRFEKFEFSPKALKSTLPSGRQTVIFSIRVAIGEHSGFVKMLLTEPLIEALYAGVEGLGEDRRAERAYMMEFVRRFDYINVPLWAEAGSVSIPQGDLGALEVGDVILFDSTQLKIEEESLKGQSTLRVGEGKNGGLLADIDVSPKKVRCKIIGAGKGEDINI